MSLVAFCYNCIPENYETNSFDNKKFCIFCVEKNKSKSNNNLCCNKCEKIIGIFGDYENKICFYCNENKEEKYNENKEEKIESIVNKLEVCKFYLSGVLNNNESNCKFNKNCDNLHPEICLKRNCICNNYHPEICNHYISGLCRFKNICWKFHDNKLKKKY